jgi:hypothetical protein
MEYDDDDYIVYFVIYFIICSVTICIIVHDQLTHTYFTHVSGA